MKQLRVGLVSMVPVYGDIPRNLEIVTEYVRELKGQGVDLVCFSEMNLTGYSRAPEIVSLAQPLDGIVIQQLQSLAQNHGVAIVAGLPLQSPSPTRPYISQVFCMPEGECRLYHKTHLRHNEQEIYTAGDTLGVIFWRSLGFGLQLCYDTHFPELSLAQAHQGAQVLLMSFASPMDTPEALRARWLRFLPARAYDSSCFVLVCNQAGQSPDQNHFAGILLAFDPDGKIIGEWNQDAPGKLIVDVDLTLVARVRQRRKFLQQRRPELYWSVKHR